MASGSCFKMVDVNGGRVGGLLGSRTSNQRRPNNYCSCSYSSTASTTQIGSLADHYRILRLQPGASEDDVKKSFRKLALQYHPDVCKGTDCKVQFQTINEAYDVVMSSLREESMESGVYNSTCNEVPDENEGMRGMFDPEYDLWEEWMGWEGAGIRDYSSHINPYI